jgi:hypothetical protein
MRPPLRNGGEARFRPRSVYRLPEEERDHGGLANPPGVWIEVPSISEPLVLLSEFRNAFQG